MGRRFMQDWEKLMYLSRLGWFLLSGVLLTHLAESRGANMTGLRSHPCVLVNAETLPLVREGRRCHGQPLRLQDRRRVGRHQGPRRQAGRRGHLPLQGHHSRREQRHPGELGVHALRPDPAAARQEPRLPALDRHVPGARGQHHHPPGALQLRPTWSPASRSTSTRRKRSPCT